MRLLNETATRNIFNVLNEDVYGIESREQAVERAAEEIFDGSDFFLNNASYKEDTSGNTNGWVMFNVTAYGGEPDEDGEIELNRDVVLPIKYNGYVEETKGLDLDDFYTLVSETLTDWVNTHNSPDSFYNESVMINTGSTTVTSDETGVVIEDNGNTITTGNGVTVDIDNEADVLPDEMDVAEPVDEIPADVIEDVPAEDIENVEPVEELPEEHAEEVEEPAEDDDEDDLDESVEEDKKEDLDEAIDKDGGPFPYLMKHGQGPGTLPDGVEIVKYGESSNDKDIVYLNKVLTAEEEAKYDMKPMEKLEDCDTKPIQEADGYNQNQNVEIYQNPEFDYQILDITELDNTDTGDVRAIDMANILNDLDESLTEALGTNNWGEINSFLTRKGTHKKTNESYSSAILELTLPRLNESVGEYKNVFMLEVYGDGAIKECVVRDSKSHIIKEYSGKSKDPVKHFEGVIYDIMNSRKLTEAVEPMVNEPEKEDNINFANSKAVDKDAERQEKHLKQHEDKNKEKEFKVEKEPDQENTTGVKEEDLTDTAEVEALPKAKKTKVDAEKIKVKEIKEEAEVITEAEDELLDEPIVTDGSEPDDELEESGSDVAIFHRKPKSVDAMRAAEQNGITVNKSNYKIVGTKELSADEFNKFANNLSSEEYEWLKEYNDTSNSGEFKCVEVVNTDDNSFSILVDPQGYNYARYAALKDNVDEEELLEPEEELIDEPTEEVVEDEK